MAKPTRIKHGIFTLTSYADGNMILGISASEIDFKVRFAVSPADMEDLDTLVEQHFTPGQEN